jgi:peptide deformylase
MTEEILTIDTGASVKPAQVEKEIAPFPLYDENYRMLESEIPLYKGQLPNFQMNNIVQRLKMTMKKYSGIGLSANQCGVYERVFVIGTEEFQLVCINPEVVNVSDEIEKDNEGCLSYPGLFLKIPRPRSIKAKFLNENGEQQEMWLDGLTARCYLHELDHMNGVKFTNKVGPVSLSQGRRKQEKILKKHVRKIKNGI